MSTILRAIHVRGICCVFLLLMVSCLEAAAAEFRGYVVFNGSAVPGAVVTASQGSRTFVAISDVDGSFTLSELKQGEWTFHVQMTGFQPVTEKLSITPNMQPMSWQLKLLPLGQMHAQIKAAGLPSAPASQPAGTQAKAASTPLLNESEANEELEERAMNGLLINGSVNNAATSPFAQIPAFGNNHRAGHWLYNGGLGVIFDNSALDARPYSLTGLNSPKPTYSNVTAIATLGGPLRIPRLLPK